MYSYNSGCTGHYILHAQVFKSNQNAVTHSLVDKTSSLSYFRFQWQATER
ncbi:hypothetical protein Hanom_Chr14g01324211 [Helianthus anomalus]